MPRKSQPALRPAQVMDVIMVHVPGIAHRRIAVVFSACRIRESGIKNSLGQYTLFILPIFATGGNQEKKTPEDELQRPFSTRAP